MKDKLLDISSSEDYIFIAIILNIFHWVILLLHGDKLITYELQFGFQAHTMQTMEYFQRHGSNVYACVMDLEKAFDLVKHSNLFRKLVEEKLPPIFIRLMISIYRE